jgi:hypothetical protein
MTSGGMSRRRGSAISRVDAEADQDGQLTGNARDIAAAGVTVDVRVDGTVRDLYPAADLSAYRIV